MVYRRLARWCVRDGGDQNSANSSLGLPAVWRWVQLLDRLPEPDTEEIQDAASVARATLASSFAEPLISFGVLPSLPQLEEEVLGYLAPLAWHHLSPEMGQGFLVDFITVSSRRELSAPHQQIYDEVVARGWASRTRLDLLRAERLAALGAYDAAIGLLETLTKVRDNHTRASAAVALVRLEMTILAGEHAEQLELLSQVIEEAKDPFQRQEALYLRALLQGEPGRQTDLRRLLAEYPEGPRTDDALFRLAEGEEALWSVDPDNEQAWKSAWTLYAQLRDFPSENDWLDSAYFRPAMALYTRGGIENLRRAAELLADYRQAVPAGAFRSLAHFWRARALEDLEEPEARVVFEEIADEQGFRFYGLRARMHLEMGPAAARELWPSPTIQAAIRQAYDQRAEGGFELDSVYHARLRAAIDSGVYASLLGDLMAVSRRFPGQRLPTISLDELDSSGLLSRVVLLLSFRQDAFSAAHWGDSVHNHLRVQTAVGYEAGDWAAAVSMAVGVFQEFRDTTPIDEVEGFLRAAYPPVYHEQIETSASRWQVPEEFLYALMRRESLFSPTAHSRAGALGLFQFVPRTFDRLDRHESWKWDLLAEANVGSRAEYLLDGERSLDLGARYLARALIREWLCRLGEHQLGCVGIPADEQPELPPRGEWLRPDLPQPDRLVPLLALLEHSKGYQNVKTWREHWAGAGRVGDFEYMIETVGSTEARILSRGVLTDTSIVDAIGMFGGE